MNIPLIRSKMKNRKNRTTQGEGERMLAFWGSLLLFSGVAAVLIAVSKNGGKRDDAPAPRSGTLRCPNCGSPAEIRGDHWECPYCGDSGSR